jgi:5-amino-6-(5-phosphoribosylamino)uracil reductase
VKVVSNTAISLDGRINTREGRFALLGTARDHARMSRLRSEADAVLVGGATFRNWPHPALPDAPDRARLGDRRPWTVVVSRTMAVPVTREFLAEPGFRPLFLTRATAIPRGFPAEAEGYDGPGDDLPVAWMLDALRRRGVERLLVEAGGDLLFQFLAADAIDEMHLTLCPLVIGGPSASLAGGPGFDLATMRRLALLGHEVEGDEIFLHYAVKKPTKDA